MIKIFFKRWVFLCASILYCLIISLKTSIAFFYFCFWFLLIVTFLSLLWVIFEYFFARIHLIRQVTSKLEEEDILDIKVNILNKGFLPVSNLIVEDYLPCASDQERYKPNHLEYLAPASLKTLQYSCKCPQRGRYKIGGLSVYFFDPLGLLFLKKKYNIYSELYVYPKVFAIKNFLPLRKGVLPWFGIGTSRFSGEDDEFYGIREYKEGDPIKKIHWISSARKNALIVKQFQRQVFYRASIMFSLEKARNYGQGKESIVEYTIKLAASIARYLVSQNISLEMIAHAQELVHLPFNKGQRHLEDIAQFLTVAEASDSGGLIEMFEEFSRRTPDHSNLIVIMLDKDWQHLQSMLPLEKRNISVIPIIMVTSTFLHSYDKKEVIKDMELKLSQSFNFRPILISQGDNLEGVFLKIK